MLWKKYEHQRENMKGNRYFAEAEAIISEAEGTWRDAVEDLKQYTPEVRRAKKEKILEEIRSVAQPKLDGLKERMTEDRDKGYAEMRAFKYPLNTPEGYELDDDRRGRENLRLQSIATAYGFPPYDAGLFELLIEQGQNHTAFLYSERVDKMDDSQADVATRLAWQSRRDNVLQKNKTFMEIQGRIEEAEAGLRRIPQLESVVAHGSMNVKFFGPPEVSRA